MKCKKDISKLKHCIISLGIFLFFSLKKRTKRTLAVNYLL
jgi:hypothetical protein